ncbi:MAG: hypothetical protein M3Z75_24740 [Actinomycetota bacterium]|nr:hypothetical protein [Actinomycetota bacterium]
MSLDAVRRIADAVLYEGYILYPYRASAQKNRSRWQWGVIMGPGYAAADPSERDFTQAEVVFEHSGQPAIQLILRFLQVQRRSTEASGPDAQAAAQTWDEAVERELEFAVDRDALLGAGYTQDFEVAGGEDREPLTADGGPVRGADDGPDAGPQAAGYAIRRRAPLAGRVSVRAFPLEGPWQAVRLQVRVQNRTAADPAPARREEALPTALVAVHVIMTVTGGEFISMIDPPEWAKTAVAECENVGGWPVLADPDGGRDIMLSSPIILYDHPEVAPESPGELYDGLEIDEILTLRTLALSDDEKRQARATDARAAALIDRVEAMDAGDIVKLHGAVRAPRPAPSGGPAGGGGGAGAGGQTMVARTNAAGDSEWIGDPDVPWWDPGADASVSPDTDTVNIGGHQIGRGSLVRLQPGKRRSDAQDMFLIGRIAEVQAVLLDVEDNPYLAVALTDDPDQDLRIAHGRFLYFSSDEVEPCEGTS